MNKAERGHLELVHSVRVPEVEIQRNFEELNNSGFNCGSIEKAIKDKEDLYQRIHIPKVDTIAEMIQETKDHILSILEEQNARLFLRRVHTLQYDRWRKELKQGYHYEDVFDDISMALFNKAERTMTREQLEEELNERGIRIMDEDLTRLLIYEINQNHLTPRILGLTNLYKPYNPLYVKTVPPGPLPAEARGILRYFDH